MLLWSKPPDSFLPVFRCFFLHSRQVAHLLAVCNSPKRLVSDDEDKQMRKTQLEIAIEDSFSSTSDSVMGFNNDFNTEYDISELIKMFISQGMTCKIIAIGGIN